MSEQIVMFKNTGNNRFKIILNKRIWFKRVDVVHDVFYNADSKVSRSWYYTNTGEYITGVYQEWIKVLEWALDHDIKSFPEEE
jgi:hypothetical protein